MNRSVYRTLYWFLFGLTIAAFYLGLRSRIYAVEWTLVALAFFGATHLLDRWYKKNHPQE